MLDGNKPPQMFEFQLYILLLEQLTESQGHAKLQFSFYMATGAGEAETSNYSITPSNINQ